MFGCGTEFKSVTHKFFTINQHTLLNELLDDNTQFKSYEVSISSTLIQLPIHVIQSLWDTCNDLVILKAFISTRWLFIKESDKQDSSHHYSINPPTKVGKKGRNTTREFLSNFKGE